jgi:hypothetical protein
MRSSLVPGDTKFAKERFVIKSPGFSDKKNRHTDDDGFPQSSPMELDECSKRMLRHCHGTRLASLGAAALALVLAPALARTSDC